VAISTFPGSQGHRRAVAPLPIVDWRTFERESRLNVTNVPLVLLPADHILRRKIASCDATMVAAIDSQLVKSENSGCLCK
jgi:hypothetical protein